jgi:hypothetical protein
MERNNQETRSIPESFNRFEARNQQNDGVSNLGTRSLMDQFKEIRNGIVQSTTEKTPVRRRAGDVMLEVFRQFDMQNQRNLAASGLNMRTSTEIFHTSNQQYEAMQKERENTRVEDVRRQVYVQSSTAVLSSEVDTVTEKDITSQNRLTNLSHSQRQEDACRQSYMQSSTVAFSSKVAESEVARQDCPAESSQSQRQRKRVNPDNNNAPKPKRARMVVSRERNENEQIGNIASVLRSLEEEFAEKERLSNSQAWCDPITESRMVSTVQEFYKEFHDVTTLPIYTCIICYCKFSQVELSYVEWNEWLMAQIEKRDDSPFKCCRCFPVGQRVAACKECVKSLKKGSLSPAANLHRHLGCEHMFPDELKGLTPMEEKLIALNSCYGFITKYSIPDGQRQSVRYPKHVKGHITVFPNNVQELVTNVLPHPLLKVMDDVHVSWQGAEKPTPSDISKLLSVRRRVVERALVWLIRYNPLYANIQIDTLEMDSWDTPSHGVPSQVYTRLERNEPSAREKTQTAQVVPPTERDQEDNEPEEIEEILAMLDRREDMEVEIQGSQNQDEGNEEGVDDMAAQIHEISSSGMFALDAQPNVREAEKLQYVYDAVDRSTSRDGMADSTRKGSTSVWQGSGTEPYIIVSRGNNFADSFDVRFFAQTFPTLFPFGKGGPRQAEEGINGVGIEVEARMGNLVSSRNMSLEKWAKILLQRHGGRFATHHIFSFLVFNMRVKSRNRQVSMSSMKRKNFPEMERIVQSLSKERLQAAKAELEATGKSTDQGVNRLLASLSIYGNRQLMSRESRLSMRRRLKSGIVREGVMGIWKTLNPNDITNPVKLRLAAYRARDPAGAEIHLTSLDQAYKRTKLSISDPLSSAIFFYRELSLFLKFFVNIGKDSVFGRISQYFFAVETNERGALHAHGVLWLRGNMHLSSVLADVGSSDQAVYRERVIRYIDSVFTEVCMVFPSQK